MKTSTTLAALFSVVAAATRERVTWNSSGTQIVGYHHAPVCDHGHIPPVFGTSVPAIILAHGLGGTQAAKLQPVAERFADEGYHAITVSSMEQFDYRHWGESDGEPRNLANLDLQRADYYAAIAAVKKIPGVDSQRIIIWGTSLSGGMVLQLGATFYNDSSYGVVGVISQVPTVNGPATAARSEPDMLPELVSLAIADQARANSSLPPIYVPTCNHTHQLRLLTQPGAWEGCHRLLPDPPAPEYGNITARIALQVPAFSPDATAAQSNLPTFMGIALADNIVGVNASIALAAKMPHGIFKQYPGAGHFDVYPGGSHYDENISAQVAFVRKFFPISRQHGRPTFASWL